MAAEKAVKLGFILSATDKMTAIIDSATSLSSNKLNEFSKKASALGDKFMSAGAKLTAPFVALKGAVAATAYKAADYATEMSRAAQKTGMGVQDFSKLAYAAKRSGLDTDEFSSALIKLNKNIIAFKTKGDKATTIFKDLNIRTDSVKNTLLDTAKVFASVEDSPAKTAAALEMFGKSGAALIPFLNKGEAGIEDLMKKCEEMGLVMNDEAVTASKKFKAELADVKDRLAGTAIQLGTDLLPMVTEFANKVNDLVTRLSNWIKENKELVQKIIKIASIVTGVLAVLGTFVLVMGTVVKSVSICINIVKGLTMAFNFLAANPIVLIIIGIVAAVALLAYGVYKLIKNWDKVSAFFSKLWEGIKNVFFAVWEWIKNLFLNYHPIGLVIKHWDTIKDFFAGLWEGVKNVFSSVWEWIKKMFLDYTPYGLIIKNWEWISTWFSEMITKFKNFGKNIIQGLVDGIKSMLNAPIKAVANIGNAIKDKFTSLLQIASPSKIFAEYGLNITQGLSGGIETGTPDAAQATQGLAMQAIQGTSGGITTNSSAVNNSSTFGGITLNYSPQVSVSGGSQQDILSALKAHSREIVQMVKDAYSNDFRLAYIS